MTTPRMTEEELNALKPSWDNPIKLICDTGHYRDDWMNIKVISPVVQGYFTCLDIKDALNLVSKNNLIHYPSLKKQPIIRRYHLWSYMSTPFNYWTKSTVYVDDQYQDTNGKTLKNLAFSDKRIKHENEFIDVEVSE